MGLRDAANARKRRLDAAIDGPAVKVTKKTTVTKSPTGRVTAQGKASVTRVPKGRKAYKEWP